MKASGTVSYTHLDVRPVARRIARAVFGVGLLAVVLGVVVTGAGPNSGDGGATRNGLDLTAAARVHSLSVWVVVLLTIVLMVFTAATAVHRAVVLLLIVEIFQGAVGYAQYNLGLPPALVALHMLGTALFTAAVAHVWWATRPAED